MSPCEISILLISLKLAGSAKSTRLARSTEEIADKGNELPKVSQQASGSAGARISLIP